MTVSFILLLRESDSICAVHMHCSTHSSVVALVLSQVSEASHAIHSPRVILGPSQGSFIKDSLTADFLHPQFDAVLLIASVVQAAKPSSPRLQTPRCSYAVLLYIWPRPSAPPPLLECIIYSAPDIAVKACTL